jgi:septum formation protein
MMKRQDHGRSTAMTRAMPNIEGLLCLASRSPRRRKLLAEAGLHAEIEPAEIDDADLLPGAVHAAHWVASLAYLKARWVAEQRRMRDPNAVCTVLGADTICVHEERILGQPRDEDEAKAMLASFRGKPHDVLTGICLIALPTGERWLGADRASVTWGDVDDAAINEYVASGQWRGKAGAYNLEERLDAGWPIECDGDPTTVMGLPMRRIAAMSGPDNRASLS